MVDRIAGYDKSGKKVFERDARLYEQNIANRTFGITIADVFKVLPVFVLIVTVYVNQQNFNMQVMNMLDQNAKAIEGMRNTLSNLNVYLSSSTGKQFRDGRPD